MSCAQVKPQGSAGKPGLLQAPRQLLCETQQCLAEALSLCVVLLGSLFCWACFTKLAWHSCGTAYGNWYRTMMASVELSCDALGAKAGVGGLKLELLSALKVHAGTVAHPRKAVLTFVGLCLVSLFCGAGGGWLLKPGLSLHTELHFCLTVLCWDSRYFDVAAEGTTHCCCSAGTFACRPCKRGPCVSMPCCFCPMVQLRTCVVAINTCGADVLFVLGCCLCMCFRAFRESLMTAATYSCCLAGMVCLVLSYCNCQNMTKWV
jgi:hypothetical protein